MADFHPMEWAEQHPYAAGGIIFVGGLGLLWLFGFFGSSSSGGATSADAAATAGYYNAEAAQVQASTALAIDQSNNQATTAQSLIQAQGAVAINASNNTASQAIASNMYASNTQINADQNNAAVAIAGAKYASDNYITGVQSNAAVAENNSNNYYSNLTAQTNAAATEFTTAVTNLAAPEMAQYGSFDITTPQTGRILGASNMWTPQLMQQAGFSNAQIQQYLGGATYP